jgi:hypothetical protein
VAGLAWGIGVIQAADTADSADPPPAIERCDSLNPCNP